MQYSPQPGPQQPPNQPQYRPTGQPNQPFAPMGQPPVAAPLRPQGPRQIVRRNPYAGGGYWGLRVNRIWRNILDGPYRSLGILGSCAVGIAIAIAIIGAANGLQTAINNILTPSNGFDPNQFGINASTISQVLAQTQSLLTKLSIGFTAAIVGLVTWISTGQRRRSISLQVQQGQRRNDLIVELLGESLILCVAGGLVGVILGYMLCGIIGVFVTSFTISPDGAGILAIFPATTVLAFGVTGLIVSYYATHTDTRQSLS